MKKVLTIAGSDSSGGAGIQADIKTITVHKMYAMSVITALTAQNTMSVADVLESSAEFTAKQLNSVFTDIFPDSVKIGMVSSKENIEVITDKLKFYKAKNIVLDPVMVSTSGSKLINGQAVETLIEKLLPVATVVTPNIPEAELICGFKINDKEDMLKAGEYIFDKYGVAVLIKGGHNINDATDLLYENGEYYWFVGKRINNSNTHGTGCTLSSAIACNLAKGCSLKESVENAKEYLTGAIGAMLNLGNGSGPIDQMYNIKVLQNIR